MTAAPAALIDVLTSACTRVGLDPAGATVVRLGENAIFLLPDRVVARIARPGQLPAATKEVAVARWLTEQGVPAVRPLRNVEQPVVVDGHPVTWWQELPQHRHATLAEIADALRLLHRLPLPAGLLGPLDPFVRLRERIDADVVLSPDDRAWLRTYVEALQDRYRTLPAGMSPTVVHGDAWGGNIVVDDDGRIYLLDLERCAIGPPEWDLVSTALRRTSFDWLSDDEYRLFADRYGVDVTVWAGYDVLTKIRELRMALYRVQRAASHPEEQAEAQLRVASIQGQLGPRPWPWSR